MTDEVAFLYDAETELRRARRTGDAEAARRARDFAQAYIGEHTDHDAEPYNGADALAYDVEAEATRIMEEKERRRRAEAFWKGTADDALSGR